MPLGLGISCKACLLYLNILSGDLFFDVLIIGLFYIYVFMGQAHGELIRGATFRIRMILVQTPLGAWLGLGTQISIKRSD